MYRFMILWMILAGLGVATLGTVVLAIDAVRLLRTDSNEEARAMYRESAPTWKAPMGQETRDYIDRLAGQITRRKQMYATGFLLFLAGFVLQAVRRAVLTCPNRAGGQRR